MANFFPRWTNYLPLQIGFCLVLLGGGVVTAIAVYWTPKYTRVGYMPDQPVPFSHKIHAGQLGMNCTYCHSFVEKTGHANVPTAETCMSCHTKIKPNSPKLAPIREAYEDGRPVEWVKIHKTPDYAYFNHSVHLNRGISCQSCHGNIPEMEVVYQAEPQSMGWCLDCHRNPEGNLRPLEDVLNFDYDATELSREKFYGGLLEAGKTVEEVAGTVCELNHIPKQEAASLEDLIKLAQDQFGEQVNQEEVGSVLKAVRGVHPPEHCTACHR